MGHQWPVVVKRLTNISHIPENDLSCLKTKLRNTSERYSKVQVPYKYKKLIHQLSRNKDLYILKQGKGRAVVLMGRTKYTNKCLELLHTNQFIKLNHDPTKVKYNVYWESSRIYYYPKNITNYIRQVYILESFIAQRKSKSYHRIDL